MIIVNGKSTKDFVSNADIEDKDVEDISLEKSLPIFNSLFTSFQAKIQSQNADDAKGFYTIFQGLINDEGTKINSLSSSLPNYVTANHVLQSKFNILNFFFKQFKIHENVLCEEKEKIYDIIFENYQKSINSLTNIIIKLEPRFSKINDTMRKQIELGLEQINDLVSNGDLNEKILKMKKEMTKTIKVFQEEKTFYLTKIERLENENKYMTEKLIKTGIQITDETNRSNKKLSGSIPLINTSSNNVLHQSQSTISNQIMSTNSNNNLNTNNTNVLTTVGVTGARELTLNMMKDVIKEIYQSKIDYDKKCVECKLPRETMEQHMYSYLNTKYGLKNLVIEWASSIILGIKQFSNEDSDVCLFGKILRNEQEEESRLVLSKLKTTINELLEMKVKAKNPLKSRGELKKIIQQKKEGMLLEEEWKSILTSIHQKGEAEMIEKRIVKVIKSANEEKKKNYLEKLKGDKNNIITREQLNQADKIIDEFEISYKEFEHILTEYQISYRDKYLKSFVTIFQKYDTDRNGVIDEDQFKEMMSTIHCVHSKGEKYIKMLLEKIDPYNFKRITFSECVTLFSVETMTDNNSSNKSNITMLDQICLDGDN